MKHYTPLLNELQRGSFNSSVFFDVLCQSCLSRPGNPFIHNFNM